jgi:hypothetical protein
MISEFLNKYKAEIFAYTVVIVHYILYILVFFNIISINIIYIDKLNLFLQLLISSFLILRFSRYSFISHNNVITNLDKRVIISSAVFMLLNVLAKEFSDYKKNIIDVSSEYLEKIKKKNKQEI